MIINSIISGNGGLTASIFVTGLSETDTVTATKDGKTYSGKWVSKPNPALVVPDGYTQLEYIESSGTQYINTGIRLESNYVIDMDVSINSGNSDRWLFGADNYSNNRYGVNSLNDTSIQAIFCASSWTSSTSITVGERFNIEYKLGSQQTCSKDGVVFGTKTNTINKSSLDLYIFSDNINNTVTSPSKMKVYTFKCYSDLEKSTLIMNLVPCKRSSDNAIGMYDLVTNTFFGNSGTGTFAAGIEVPQTIDGFLIDNIKSYGTYTITATDGTNTATQDVLVDMATDYVVEIGYIPNDAVAEFLFDGNLNDSKNRYTFTNSGITLSDSKAYFNGDAYAIASDKITPLGSAISISLWAKFDSTSAAYYILSQNNSGESFNGYALFLTSERNLDFQVWVNDSRKAELVSSYVDTNWHHICITWNGLSGGIVKLYIDGVLDKSISASSVAPTTANRNLVLGAYYESSAYKYRPNGYMDNIRFYNRELSFGEVMRLFSEVR